MIQLPDLEPETVTIFVATVSRMFPGTTYRLIEQTIMGPPYLIIWIPDEMSVIPITLCVGAGQGLQGVDKDDLRVVDLGDQPT